MEMQTMLIFHNSKRLLQLFSLFLWFIFFIKLFFLNTQTLILWKILQKYSWYAIHASVENENRKTGNREKLKKKNCLEERKCSISIEKCRKEDKKIKLETN